MPSEDQQMRVWVDYFFANQTTSHGINQAFKEFNGFCRKLFWISVYIFGLYISFSMLSDAIESFVNADTKTSVSSGTHSGLLPMITVCNLSPIRCGCDAFYDSAILDNISLVQSVLPFVCSTVVSLRQETLDARINLSSALFDDVRQHVDIQATVASMRQFASTAAFPCGREVLPPDSTAYIYTSSRANVVAKGLMNAINHLTAFRPSFEQIVEGNFTLLNLYAYAGYTARDVLVRGCTAVESNESSSLLGRKVACMDDSWWSSPFFDSQAGACHTFNPCHGFPVGQPCVSNDDCKHDIDHSLQGGICNFAAQGTRDGGGGMCTCTRCAKGENCRISLQPKPGQGLGVRIIADVEKNKEPLLDSATNARWSYGLLVHLHSQFEAGNLAEGVSLAPGHQTFLSVARGVFLQKQYPFSNCSASFTVQPAVCRERCLRRLQAIRCCGGTPQEIRKGHASPLVASGNVSNIIDPTLLCSALDSRRGDCFAEQINKMANGVVCIPGSQSFDSFYYGGLWKRTNWYNDDVLDPFSPEISSQERRSMAIARHCIWPATTAASQPRYGAPCDVDADCPPRGNDGSTATVAGRCQEAFRAYCPPRCSRVEYDVVATSIPLSDATVRLIAAHQLSLSTARARLGAGDRRWRAMRGRQILGLRCATEAEAEAAAISDELGDNNTFCFSEVMARRHVRDNYVMFSADFPSFEQRILTKVEGVTVSSLAGTLGGNLGVFTGFSLMTLLELLELLVFLLAAAPFFCCGVRPWPFVRPRSTNPVTPQVPPLLQQGTNTGSSDLSLMTRNQGPRPPPASTFTANVTAATAAPDPAVCQHLTSPLPPVQMAASVQDITIYSGQKDRRKFTWRETAEGL